MSNWNKFAEGLGRMANKAGEQIQKKGQDLERTFQNKLRTMSDQEIKNGLRKIESSDWRYRFVVSEASRRGIY